MNLMKLEEIADMGILSSKAILMITRWITDGKIQNIDRPSWNDVFLMMAYDIAKRSCDTQYQAGAVIANSNNHIIGVGYNGHTAGIEHGLLPTVRPDKYPFMLHAELNAILNCEHKPRGATIYVTGHPCLQCYQCINNVHISTIVYDINKQANMINEEMEIQLEIIKWATKHRIQVIGYDYKGPSND
jgi:deoxycytidylate deaminase